MLIVNALVGTFNNKPSLVRAFSENCETSRRFVDTSNIMYYIGHSFRAQSITRTLRLTEAGAGTETLTMAVNVTYTSGASDNLSRWAAAIT